MSFLMRSVWKECGFCSLQGLLWVLQSWRDHVGPEPVKEFITNCVSTTTQQRGESAGASWKAVAGSVAELWAERASRVLFPVLLQLRSCSSPSPTASCPFAILWMLGHSQRDRITKNKTPLPGAPPKLESEAPSELPSSPS